VKKQLFAGTALVGVALLTSLGVWQLQRLAWKRDLIERVDQRVAAPAVPAPPSSAFDPLADEYKRVALRGRFLNDRETLVQAATKLGGGFWVMTPLRTESGFTVLVNRGFVPTSRRESREWAREEGEVSLTGLLRLTEPVGGFLRENQPYADRWYSRDVAQIAAVRGVDLAPYFVDADTQTSQLPIGGLTVVAFSDNHLQYALTWFALALMLAYGGFRILRS
jgi:surfeit locus 1 family protein